jgi:hypothetical protein
MSRYCREPCLSVARLILTRTSWLSLETLLAVEERVRKVEATPRITFHVRQIVPYPSQSLSQLMKFKYAP